MVLGLEEIEVYNATAVLCVGTVSEFHILKRFCCYTEENEIFVFAA